MSEPAIALPDVSRTAAGQIVVRLAPKHATVLARLLAHYDVLVSVSANKLRAQMYEDPADPLAPTLPQVAGYDHGVWQHTLVRLLVEKAQATTPPAEIVNVRRLCIPGTPSASACCGAASAAR